MRTWAVEYTRLPEAVGQPRLPPSDGAPPAAGYNPGIIRKQPRMTIATAVRPVFQAAIGLDDDPAAIGRP